MRDSNEVCCVNCKYYIVGDFVGSCEHPKFYHKDPIYGNSSVSVSTAVLICRHRYFERRLSALKKFLRMMYAKD